MALSFWNNKKMKPIFSLTKPKPVKRRNMSWPQARKRFPRMNPFIEVEKDE